MATEKLMRTFFHRVKLLVLRTQEARQDCARRRRSAAGLTFAGFCLSCRWSRRSGP